MKTTFFLLVAVSACTNLSLFADDPTTHQKPAPKKEKSTSVKKQPEPKQPKTALKHLAAQPQHPAVASLPTPELSYATQQLLQHETYLTILNTSDNHLVLQAECTTMNGVLQEHFVTQFLTLEGQPAVVDPFTCVALPVPHGARTVFAQAQEAGFKTKALPVVSFSKKIDSSIIYIFNLFTDLETSGLFLQSLIETSNLFFYNQTDKDHEISFTKSGTINSWFNTLSKPISFTISKHSCLLLPLPHNVSNFVIGTNSQPLPVSSQGMFVISEPGIFDIGAPTPLITTYAAQEDPVTHFKTWKKIK